LNPWNLGRLILTPGLQASNQYIYNMLLHRDAMHRHAVIKKFRNANKPALIHHVVELLSDARQAMS